MLVLLGTQDKPFTRLLDAISDQIKNGNIKEKVVVQAGHTKYESNGMEIFDLIPTTQLSEMVKEADLIITHGGVGSIMECIKNNKTVIAVPRLKQYGEHVNDHQLQIVEEFANKGYIIPLYDTNELGKALIKTKQFKLTTYKSNNNKFVHFIEDYIDSKI